MTRTRVLTALVLLPAVVALVYWGSQWMVAAVLWLVIALALKEFFELSEKAGMRGLPAWTILCTALLLYAQVGVLDLTWPGSPGMNPISGLTKRLTIEIALLIFLLGSGVIVLARKRPVGEALGSLAATAGGMVLVALPLSYLVRLHGAVTLGPKLALYALSLVWVGDTAAFFVGRAIGRHKLAPEWSPGKTVEGAIANLVASAILAVVCTRWLTFGLLHLLGVAVVASVFGQAGDIVESACKRSVGVKDSGSVLPGHGGVLDRIDALIFAVPAVWVYLTFVVR
jgi:phosphatidate cytidylyltransferase